MDKSKNTLKILKKINNNTIDYLQTKIQTKKNRKKWSVL